MRLCTITIIGISIVLVGVSNSHVTTITKNRDSDRQGRIFFNLLSPILNALNGNLDDDNDHSDNKPNIVADKCSCECGIPNSELRIVGGQPTAVNRYPWVARLVYRKSFLCGASLISKKYVITAAHCVNNKNIKDINVILGDHDQTTTSDTPAKLRKISMVMKHRNFDPNTFNNDIAVLKLRKPIPFAKNIQPVCLPPKGLDPAGNIGTILGWGRSSEGGTIADKVQEAQVPILNLTQCRSLKYRASMISNNMICAGGGKRDACQGDSGGPLLVQRHSNFELVGITSWGLGCGRVGYPGVYTRIDRYMSWIEMNLETNASCLCAA